MIEIGAFEARGQLSALLDRVQRGEEIVITRRGRAIAKLIPDNGAVRESSESHAEPMPFATSNSH